MVTESVNESAVKIAKIHVGIDAMLQHIVNLLTHYKPHTEALTRKTLIPLKHDLNVLENENMKL